jgi:predicted SnoaL-like aldol condensation-catalyzing enzyme
MRPSKICAAGIAAFLALSAPAQEKVVGVPDPDALFTSADPTLNANKQVAYHIVKDLLEANHWELADRYLSEGYVQHNPNAASGRDAVVRYFRDIVKAPATPIPEKLRTPIVSVVAEGDLVIVVYPRKEKSPKGAYTTSWFDQWRIRDGKAVEHWDPATRE